MLPLWKNPMLPLIGLFDHTHTKIPRFSIGSIEEEILLFSIAHTSDFYLVLYLVYLSPIYN